MWHGRAGEVGLELSVDVCDPERLFVAEWVGSWHLSGLVAALSPKTSAFCVELARRAKASGTAVSLDLNYRTSFWEGRRQEPRAAKASTTGSGSSARRSAHPRGVPGRPGDRHVAA